MKESIVYRLEEFTDPDYSRLIRLTESTYPGREISNQDYLQWEYEKNPHGNALIHVASEGEKLVAQYLVIPHDYIVEGKILKGSLSLNTLTHPIHRGNALFPKLAEQTYLSCLRNNVIFTLGVPNANSFPVFKDHLNFEILGRVPFLIKSFKPKSVLWHLFTRKRLKHGLDIELNTDSVRDAGGDLISCFNPNTDAESYEAFLKRFTEEKSVATYRSIDFLRWRYLDIPIRKYHIFKQMNDGKITAFAVIRCREIYGLRSAVLMDFIFTGDQKSARAFIDQIFELLEKNNIELIICAMQGSSNEFNLLKKAGFYKVPERFLPQQLDLIIKVHKEVPESEHIRNFKSWFFTFGDYDIF